MRYLRKYIDKFDVTQKSGRYRFHLNGQHDFQGLAPALSKLRATERSNDVSRTSQALALDNETVFIKRFAAGDFKHSLRMTFGLKRRRGGLDWPIAELINSCEVSARSGGIPELLGFGYRLSAFGLVDEVYLLFNLLDGYVNGIEWLDRIKGNPADMESFLSNCIHLVASLHQRDIYHLDPWLENIMVHPDRPGELIPIDVENCFIGKPDAPFVVAGFQFGYMFQRGPMRLFSEERFDEMVRDVLKTYPAFEESHMEPYTQCKRSWLGRKQRQLTPYGVIKPDEIHPFPNQLIPV